MKVGDAAEMPCSELVELVTDYLVQALDASDRARFEQHLFACTWCMTYFRQFNQTIALTRKLRGLTPSPAALAALLRDRQKKS